MDLLYLDHNATTPLLPAVWEAMRPYFFELAGNPASSHRPGQKARRALEDARERTAALLDAFPDEVIFTSGATEANNLAVFGLAGDPPGHIITSPIEHPSVTEPVRRLVSRGCCWDVLPVNSAGVVRPQALRLPLSVETRLLSVMLVNHETGAIQPVQELAGRVGNLVALHTDAAAAVGKIPVSFHGLNVMALTLSAHKFHGPVGIGALLMRRHFGLRPQLFGGHQQQGRRPGTEAVALAVGLATALDLAVREMESRTATVRGLRRHFLDGLREAAAPVVLNGPEEGGVPYTLNLSFPGCQADALLISLDLAGVACATGSACSSGSLLPSPVLQAMGLPPERLHSAMRFSLSPFLTQTEITEAVRRIADTVRRLREMPVG